MDHFLVRTIAALALLGLVSYAASFAPGENAGWILFSGGLFALLAYHLWNLRLLLRWLNRADAGNVPSSTGVWDDAFAQLYRRERDHAKERQRLGHLLRRFRQASRALPDSIVVLDTGNRIQWCNEAAERHFGIDSQSDVGQPITNLVRQPELVNYIGTDDYSEATQIGSIREPHLILSVQIIPYGDSQKLLLARDVTQAEKIDRIRRDFVANVSHELRTPVTVMVGFLETIRELDLDTQRSRNYLDMMAEQSGRMQRLLDDLLTLSSLESAPAPPRDERIVMSRVLARIRADAELLSAGRHRIILEAADSHDLLGAENEIVSAFGNLVSNAIRYTPLGGEIRIVWTASAEGARFSIQDTGVGIAPEHISRLTERFYRVDRSRSRDTGGTGLGLAIVKHALLRHQASLDIESEPGKGSRFTARFPARRVVAAQPSPSVAA